MKQTPQPDDWRIREAMRLLNEELVRLCQIRGGLDERIRQLQAEIDRATVRMKEIEARMAEHSSEPLAAMETA